MTGVLTAVVRLSLSAVRNDAALTGVARGRAPMVRSGLAALAVSCVALVLVLVLASPAAAEVSPLTATFEGGDFSQFTETNVANGQLANVVGAAYDGTRAAGAYYSGGGDNGYARTVEYVHWVSADDVWYGSAFYLPAWFKNAIQGEVSLMRWDNWPTYGSDADQGGIAIWGSDKRARLKLGTYTSPETILAGPFDIPTGRWVWLEVHQKFSTTPGDALSEVYMDGKPVGSSTQPNFTGRPIERIRYGVVAIASGAQTYPLLLWFDRSTVSTSEVGPRDPSP